VVLVSLMITDFLISSTVSKNIRKHQEEKARWPEIVLPSYHHWSIRRRRKMVKEYTKKFNLPPIWCYCCYGYERIRQSHPNPDQIGKHFVGGWKGNTKGKRICIKFQGTLSESLRAFTPIYNKSGEQIVLLYRHITNKCRGSSAAISILLMALGCLLGSLVPFTCGILKESYLDLNPCHCQILKSELRCFNRSWGIVVDVNKPLR
jgi:CitB family two-component system sensor histidine kinase MalK